MTILSCVTHKNSTSVLMLYFCNGIFFRNLWNSHIKNTLSCNDRNLNCIQLSLKLEIVNMLSKIHIFVDGHMR